MDVGALRPAPRACTVHTMTAPMPLAVATLHSRLRRSRRAADISQVQLAEALGVSQSIVSRWERGEVEPPRGMVIAWAWLTSTDAGWLLGDATLAPRRRLRPSVDSSIVTIRYPQGLRTRKMTRPHGVRRHRALVS
jgi:transcriptional regulator with XRE-family HTH domain